MKRFWKEVTVGADRGIALDAHPVRTPGRAPLVPPTSTLAEAIANEWRNVGETINPGAMPLTGLANAAIDRIAPDPQAFAADLAAYGESDLLCYRAAEPAPLVERQNNSWNPLLDWARGRYDVHFELATGVMHRAQPAATIQRLAEAITARDPFELAPLSPIVTISGSLILALAVLEGALDAEAAWKASRIDEDWQAELWGEDSLAIEAAEAKHRDFIAAVRFLELIKP